ncbi:MAG TPA: hypothetical protein P5080_03260 [Candidatus Paceibacterota bacterium]|nr:hypothetical protein [Candidatus Pacearchaeota archaeon]HRZ50986.1 hypothetical protein [Candidatus Paceibacterota bacterium]HSA36707.1 hypothetical protein [Candidatus Paceibacterota bacterium]
MNDRSALFIGIVSGILLAEFIIYGLGFLPDSFGFWALYIQLGGCVIIAFRELKLPAANQTISKDGQV